MLIAAAIWLLPTRPVAASEPDCEAADACDDACDDDCDDDGCAPESGDECPLTGCDDGCRSCACCGVAGLLLPEPASDPGAAAVHGSGYPRPQDRVVVPPDPDEPLHVPIHGARAARAA